MTDLTIVDVWAEWCAPCKKFGPIFEVVSAKHPDVKFLKINADENMEFLNKFGIRGIPTILVLKDGVEVYRHAGILSESNLEQLISNYY